MAVAQDEHWIESQRKVIKEAFALFDKDKKGEKRRRRSDESTCCSIIVFCCTVRSSLPSALYYLRTKCSLTPLQACPRCEVHEEGGQQQTLREAPSSTADEGCRYLVLNS